MGRSSPSTHTWIEPGSLGLPRKGLCSLSHYIGPGIQSFAYVDFNHLCPREKIMSLLKKHHLCSPDTTGKAVSVGYCMPCLILKINKKSQALSTTVKQ